MSVAEDLPLATRDRIERLSKMLDLMAEWLDFDGDFNDPWVNAAGGVAQIAAAEARLMLGLNSRLDEEEPAPVVAKATKRKAVSK